MLALYIAGLCYYLYTSGVIEPALEQRVAPKVRTQCFVYYKPRTSYQRHKTVQKVVESFKQHV